MKKNIFLFVMLFVTAMSYAQVRDVDLGAYDTRLRNPQGGMYDYSDPEALNIRVAVWGWVKYPGKYRVPIYTTVYDLLSYAGGPLDDSIIDDMKLFRIDEEGNQELIKIQFENLLFQEKLRTSTVEVPKLHASDILVIPGEPKLYFRERLSIWLSILSAAVSLTILYLNITRN
ncbi:MAG: SLBB domain-containing protein [Melioribacteraceae bacterium]|nr:SLBB domain-containing protein [Melioribacteraceae bacterium]